MTITLEQHNSIPSIQDIDSIENWTMIFSNPLKRKKFPYQEQILNRYNKLSQKDKNGFPVAIDLPNKNLSGLNRSKNLLRNLKFFQLDFPACQAENLSGTILTIFPISSIK